MRLETVLEPAMICGVGVMLIRRKSKLFSYCALMTLVLAARSCQPAFSSLKAAQIYPRPKGSKPTTFTVDLFNDCENVILPLAVFTVFNPNNFLPRVP